MYVYLKDSPLCLQELKPGNYLKDTIRLQTHEPQLSSVKPAAVMPPPVVTPQPDPSLILTASTPTVTTTVTTTTTAPSSGTPNLPPRPQFAYEDINTNNFATLANQILISGQVLSITMLIINISSLICIWQCEYCVDLCIQLCFCSCRWLCYRLTHN